MTEPVRDSERSSAPEVPLISTQYVRDRMHTLGGAFSVGIRTGSFDLSIGATGLFGVGEGLAIVRGAAGEPLSYRTTDIKDTSLLVFMTGARQAVKTLVKRVIQDEPSKKP